MTPPGIADRELVEQPVVVGLDAQQREVLVLHPLEQAPGEPGRFGNITAASTRSVFIASSRARGS